MVTSTQKEKAMALFSSIAIRKQWMYETHKQLELVLHAAQNDPQYGGGSDGSLDESNWTKLSDFDHRLNDLIFEIENVQRKE